MRRRRRPETAAATEAERRRRASRGCQSWPGCIAVAPGVRFALDYMYVCILYGKVRDIHMCGIRNMYIYIYINGYIYYYIYICTIIRIPVIIIMYTLGIRVIATPK